MKKMAISIFKANALKIIDIVAKNHESIIITKRGKPMAELIPFRSSGKKPLPGKLSHSLVFEKDIITPLGEDMWESGR